jgi:predicted glycosyltransferase
MKIWVDLANSPQVLFFRPILSELERRGHTVLITSRDFAQTVALADQHRLAHTPVGNHGGRRWSNIVYRTGERALALAAWARRHGPFDLAVSHNSYSQALAAALVRIPFVTTMDYEHQPFNHVCFRLARRVIVPATFPAPALAQYGAARKAVRYQGLKEQVYLSGFTPTSDYLQQEGIPADKVIVAMRPPAPWAAYHRQFDDTLFDEVLAHLLSQPDVFVIFLPRVPEQGQAARALGHPNLHVPPQVLDGPNLLYHADLVISGGGTMNREAAVLGTPVYTVFKGLLGAGDQLLIDQGRMVQVSEPEDIPQIRVVKHDGGPDSVRHHELIAQITDLILTAGGLDQPEEQRKIDLSGDQSPVA